MEILERIYFHFANQPGVQVNRKALACVILLALVVMIGVPLIHHSQHAKISDGLLELARNADAAKDYVDATKLYGRYLNLRPDDLEARQRYANLVYDNAKTGPDFVHSYMLLEKLLLLSPELHEERRKVISAAMLVGRSADARAHLELLISKTSRDADLLTMLGQYHETLYEFDDAERLYREAIKKDPSYELATLALAELLITEQDSPQQAMLALVEFVLNDPENPLRYAARLEFQLRHPTTSDPKRMARDLANSLEKGPENPRVLRGATNYHWINRNPDQAILYAEKLLAVDPSSDSAVLLATLRRSAGQITEAIAELQHALKSDATNTTVLAELCRAYIDHDQFDEARSTLGTLNELTVRPDLLDLLKIRISVQEGHVVDAAHELESLLKRELSSDTQLEAQLLLAECFKQSGNQGREVATLGKAEESAPRNPSVLLAYAEALAKQGRIDEAIVRYELVLGQHHSTQPVLLKLGRLYLLRAAKAKPEARAYEPLVRIITQLKSNAKENPEVVLLDVGLELLRGEADEARAILEKQINDDPAVTVYHLALAEIDSQNGKLGDALKTIDNAEINTGTSHEILLARLRVIQRTEADEFRAQAQKVEAKAESLEKNSRVLVLKTLSELYRHKNLVGDAVRVLQNLTTTNSNDLSIWSDLFTLQLVAAQPNQEFLQNCIKEVDRIEGTPSPIATSMRARMALQKAGTDRKQLEEIPKYLEELGPFEATNPSLRLIRAHYEELVGNTDGALDLMLEAVRAGARDGQLISRLTDVLYERGRLKDASELFEMLKSDQLGANSIRAPIYSTQIAVLNNDLDWALRSTEEKAAADPDDPTHKLTIANLTLLKGDAQAAEQQFRQVVLDHPTSILAHRSLLVFLVQQEQTNSVDTVIQAARNSLPENEFPLFMVYASLALGDGAGVGTWGPKALEVRPSDPATIKACAQAALTIGKREKSWDLLTKLIDPKTDVPESDRRWARRNLALSLAGTGVYPQLQRAIQILNQNSNNGRESLANLRARTQVLAQSPSKKERDQALRILESLAKTQSPALEDLQVLAALYRRRGMNEAFIRIVRQILVRSPDAIERVMQLTIALARDGQLEEAQEHARRIPKLDPAPWQKIMVEVSLLHASGKSDEARKICEDFLFVDKIDEDLWQTRISKFLPLLDELKWDGLVDRVFSRPGQGRDRLLEYASWLTRKDRIGEAIELCQSAWTNAPDWTVARVWVMALRAGGKSTAADSVTSREMIQDLAAKVKTLSDQSQSVIGLHVLAELHDLLGNYSQARKVHEAIVQQDPSNVIALNNLAWALASDPSTVDRKALDVIDRAIELAGPIAAMLDTRGTVLYKLGRWDESIKSYEASLYEQESVSVYFHLALAQNQAGQEGKARLNLRKALEEGLTDDKIHPTERADLAQLKSLLTR